jgi:excisionase family DNA binding protein
MADRRTPPSYLTLTEAAELMSVSVRTVRRRISDGTIPAYRCGRRVIRVRFEDLELAFHRIPSART